LLFLSRAVCHSNNNDNDSTIQRISLAKSRHLVNSSKALAAGKRDHSKGPSFYPPPSDGARIIRTTPTKMSLASGTSGVDRPVTTPGSSKSRYQRLHHRDEVVDSIVEVDRDMTASPVLRGRNTSNNTSLTTPSPDRPSWSALSTEDVGEKERRSDEDDEEDDNRALHTSRSHQSLVSGLSPNTSIDWNDDLQDDDDMIRRYHHVIHTRVPTLPAEFAGKESRGNATGIGVQLWAALGELRQGARQRRAARLLNPNSRHDFCQTWFCDATDRGIALAAALTAAWLLVGILTHARAFYWWLGFLLFIVRVSARTSYEAFTEHKRKRKHRASTAPMASTGSSNVMELAGGNNGSGKSPNHHHHYRDQDASLIVPMV